MDITGFILFSRKILVYFFLVFIFYFCTNIIIFKFSRKILVYILLARLQNSGVSLNFMYVLWRHLPVVRNMKTKILQTVLSKQILYFVIKQYASFFPSLAPPLSPGFLSPFLPPSGLSPLPPSICPWVSLPLTPLFLLFRVTHPCTPRCFLPRVPFPLPSRFLLPRVSLPFSPCSLLRSPLPFIPRCFLPRVLSPLSSPFFVLSGFSFDSLLLLPVAPSPLYSTHLPPLGPFPLHPWARLPLLPQVRAKNLYTTGDSTHFDQLLEKCNVRRCWEEVTHQADYHKRKEAVDLFNA